MRYRIKENEKKSISSQHEEFDSNILNFLMRRINVEKRKLGGNFGDFEPLTTIEYSFNGFPGHGFNSYQSRSLIRINFDRKVTAQNKFNYS